MFIIESSDSIEEKNEYFEFERGGILCHKNDIEPWILPLRNISGCWIPSIPQKPWHSYRSPVIKEILNIIECTNNYNSCVLLS